MGASLKRLYVYVSAALLLAGSAGAQTAPTCTSTLLLDTFYSIRPHYGKPVQKLRWRNETLSLQKIQAEWANILGQGAEGTVYRVRDQVAPRNFVIKSFHVEEEDSYWITQRLLKYWGDLSSELKESPVEIVRYKRGPLPFTLIYEDVRGESVLRIMESDRYSESLKKRFAQKFLLALGDFVDAMIKANPEIELMHCCLAQDHFDSLFGKYMDSVPELYGLENKNDPRKYLFFTPQNILYDRDNDRFVIIDPV